MCCLWTNKQFATNLNCKPNHQWIFLLFSLYFLIKFLWNCLCSTHRYFEMQFSFTSDEIVLQFLGVVRISPWSNSTVTLFCTYQSTDYGRVIRAFFSKYPKWFFPIGQMVELIVGYLGYIPSSIYSWFLKYYYTHDFRPKNREW